MTSQEKEMIEEFQCPGCVCGSDTECVEFEEFEPNVFQCKKHCMGTMSFPGGKFALGLPRGFCKEGYHELRLSTDKPKKDEWDNLNIPVWALEQNGYLFIKTISPRINKITVSVYKDSKIEDIKSDTKPFDVSKIYDEIG